MDLGVPVTGGQAAESSGDQPAAKKREIQNTLQEAVQNCAKLSLANAQATRALKATVFECIRMPVDSQWAAAHKEGTVGFMKLLEETKKTTKDADKIRQITSHPSVHGFNMLVKKYIEQGAPHAQLLKDSAAHWTSELVAEQVKHCKLCKMYGGKTVRLEIAVPLALTMVTSQPPTAACPAWAWVVVRESMLKTPNHVVMRGQAPPGELERQLQTWLDAK